MRESPATESDNAVIGIEEELRGELIPGVPDLLARIDLLTTTSDTLVVTDFKTARSRWSQSQAENSADQLLLYSELARRMLPDMEVRLRFLVLTKTKSPAVEAFDVDVSSQRVQRTVTAVEHTWRAIEAGHFYPAPERSTDSVFLRRVYLDLVGMIPTYEETTAFLDDTDPNKREKLIDKLLADPRYARNQAQVWDVSLLGRNPKGIRQTNRDAFRKWLATHFEQNVPYDRIVHKLLKAEEDNSKLCGWRHITFRVGC